MTKISVIHATNEGQTRKIAQYMASVIEQKGYSAVIVNCSRVPPTFSLQSFDAVLIGASMHIGQFQGSVREFVSNHLEQLQPMPSAFFSVSLRAASQRARDRAQVHQSVTAFQKQTGWRPSQVACIAGALKYSRYGVVKRWFIQRIAKKIHADTENTARPLQMSGPCRHF